MCYVIDMEEQRWLRQADKDLVLDCSKYEKDFHEGSDIDFIMVGEFEGKMPQRIHKILDLTSLPIEPLVYTEAEFEQTSSQPTRQTQQTLLTRCLD